MPVGRRVDDGRFGRKLGGDQAAEIVPAGEDQLGHAAQFVFELTEQGVVIVAPVVIGTIDQGPLGVEVVPAERTPEDESAFVAREGVFLLAFDVEDVGPFLKAGARCERVLRFFRVAAVPVGHYVKALGGIVETGIGPDRLGDLNPADAGHRGFIFRQCHPELAGRDIAVCGVVVEPGRAVGALDRVPIAGQHTSARGRSLTVQGPDFPPGTGRADASEREGVGGRSVLSSERGAVGEGPGARPGVASVVADVDPIPETAPVQQSGVAEVGLGGGELTAADTELGPDDFAGRWGLDVEDAGIGVSAVQRRAGAADQFHGSDILGRHRQGIPFLVAEEAGGHVAAVDQDQNSAVQGGVEPAGVDVEVVDAVLGQIDPGHRRQGEWGLTGDRGGLKGSGIDDRNGRRRLGGPLRSFGGGGDDQVVQRDRLGFELGIGGHGAAGGHRHGDLGRLVAEPPEHQGVGAGGNSVEHVTALGVGNGGGSRSANPHHDPGERGAIIRPGDLAGNGSSALCHDRGCCEDREGRRQHACRTKQTHDSVSTVGVNVSPDRNGVSVWVEEGAPRMGGGQGRAGYWPRPTFATRTRPGLLAPSPGSA